MEKTNMRKNLNNKKLNSKQIYEKKETSGKS